MSNINFIGASGGGPSGSGGVSYFVDGVAGNDSNTGLSPASAFKTITKANATPLLPGMSMLFKGGQTFSGALVALVGGLLLLANPAAPATFGSYGGGQATISSGASAGFVSTAQPGIIVRDLTFTGNGTSNATNGIYFDNNDGGGTRHFQNIQVINCTVSGYGYSGIYVAGTSGSAGYDDVLIDGCVVFGCCFTVGGAVTNVGTGGIVVASNTGFGLGSNPASFINVLIRKCRAYNNLGCADSTNWTGTGILIAETNYGRIVDCIASGNGGSSVGGPAGIWTADSTYVTIESCQSISNHTGTTHDGNGFGIDEGCQYCTIIDCYSEGNDGTGFLIFSGTDTGVTSNDHCSIINCVSKDDGTANNATSSSIAIGGNNATTTNIRLSGNKCYQSNSSVPVIRIVGSQAAAMTGLVTGNQFTASGAQPLVYTTVNPASLTFDGNQYVSPSFHVTWNNTSYTSLDAWQGAASQETNTVENFGPVAIETILQGPVGSLSLKGAIPTFQLEDTETHGLTWQFYAQLNGTQPYIAFYSLNTPDQTYLAINFDGTHSTQIQSGAVYGWSSNARYADGAAMDTGISRGGANSISFGDGTPFDTSAQITARILRLNTALNEQIVLTTNTVYPAVYEVSGTSDGTQITRFVFNEASTGKQWNLRLGTDYSLNTYFFDGVSSFIGGPKVTDLGSFVPVTIGPVATNATDGFLYIPTCAGTPTGTPTTQTGTVPLVYDTTNNQLWIYAGGAWKQPKTPAGAATVNWQ